MPNSTASTHSQTPSGKQHPSPPPSPSGPSDDLPRSPSAQFHPSLHHSPSGHLLHRSTSGTPPPIHRSPSGKALNPLVRSMTIVPDDAPQWRQQLGVFLLTYLSYCALYSTRKPFSVVKADIQEDLGISTHSLGIIETSFLTSYALGQLIIPPATQHFIDPPTLLLISFLGSCVFAVIFGSSSLATWMLLIWALNGLFHASVYPLLVRIVAPWFGSAVRGRVLGTWTTSQQSGSFLATAFAAYAADAFGWRWTFYLPAALVGVTGFVLYFCAPRGCTVGANQPKVSQPNLTLQHKQRTLNRADSPSSSLIINPSNQVAENTPIYPSSAALRLSFSGATHSPPLTPLPGAGTVRFGPPTEPFLEGIYGSTSVYSSSSALGQSNFRVVRACSVRSTVSTARCHMAKGCELEGPRVTVLQVLQMPDLVKVASAFFFIKCVRYSLLFWLSFYLVKALGYPKPTAGYSSVMFDVGGIFGAIFTGFLSDKILRGRRLLAATIMTSCACVGVLLFSFVSRYGFYYMITTMTLVGFCMAGPDSVLGAAAAGDLCDRSAHGVKALTVAAGIVNGMGSSGAAIQGFLTAGISVAYGWHATYIMLSLFLATAATLLLFSLKRESDHVKRDDGGQGLTHSVSTPKICSKLSMTTQLYGASDNSTAVAPRDKKSLSGHQQVGVPIAADDHQPPFIVKPRTHKVEV